MAADVITSLVVKELIPSKIIVPNNAAGTNYIDIQMSGAAGSLFRIDGNLVTSNLYTADNNLDIKTSRGSDDIEFYVSGAAFMVMDSGERSLYIYEHQAGNIPATPTGKGVLYVSGGALTYKGTSGTVTILGAA